MLLWTPTCNFRLGFSMKWRGIKDVINFTSLSGKLYEVLLICVNIRWMFPAWLKTNRNVFYAGIICICYVAVISINMIVCNDKRCLVAYGSKHRTCTFLCKKPYPNSLCCCEFVQVPLSFNIRTINAEIIITSMIHWINFSAISHVFHWEYWLTAPQHGIQFRQRNRFRLILDMCILSLCDIQRSRSNGLVSI